MDKIILNTKDLSVGYDKNVLISDINFSVNKGEILVLIGPNGAGKSTILKTITSQLKAISGVVVLDDKELNVMNEKEIAKKMSILMTKHPKTELMSVEDMVSTGRYPYTGRLGILSDNDKKIVSEVIEKVNLQDIKDKDFEKISDGQKQRVMLARAICQEPEILIMDEPTSFLDIHHKLELLSILKKMVRERNMAVILSLHELDLAQKCADNLLCIDGGRIDRYGSAEEIFEKGNDYIKHLYKVEKGSFIDEYGSVELEKIEGEPKVFVIGGGGSGIPVYRRLQRQGIPFIAGVLHENDIDYPVAKALATKVISEKPFESISDEAFLEAKECMEKCDRVISNLKLTGTMNRKNQELIELAKQAGKLEEDIWQK